jgi:regulatory protein
LAKKITKTKEANIKSRALNLLSYRPRSVHELTRALGDRGFEKEAIDDTVAGLEKSGYLNDSLFASELAASRLRNKHWGRRKIAFDLGNRGISKEIVTKVLGEISDEAEEDAAQNALKKWLRKRGVSLPLEKDLFASAYRHLSSRGFPSTTIYLVLKRP